MSTPLTQILTPTGRLIQGDCFEPQTKDAEGKPLIIKTGPNAGQPRVDYFMAIAIPKTDPGFQEILSAIHGVAAASFPQLFDASGNCINPAFAFKITDGDSVVPNTKGVRPCDRDHFPGNWVLNFSGGFAPKCYTAGGAELISNPAMLKRGYYIRIYGSVKSNGSTQQPGIFLNHSMVELVAYGEEIFSGPSGDAVFGGTPAGALPAGASATPMTTATPIAQTAVATPTPGAAVATPTPTPGAAVATPTPGAAVATPTPTPQAVVPATDFLKGPATHATPTPPPAKYLDANGVAFTAEQLLAAGFSAVQIQALPRA